ncbi:MAG: hypothetical protein ABW123_28250 [Cystobacter sp.]
MRYKFAESMFLFLALLFPPCARAQASAGTAAPGDKLLGQCFANAQEALQAVFGAAGLDDENITVRPAQTLSDGRVWVVDRTPGSNYAWYLLQPNEGFHFCLTLYVPAAASVEVNQRGTTQTATAKTQASPGQSMKQATYQRRKGARVFSFNPTSCLKITLRDDGERSLLLSSEDALLESLLLRRVRHGSRLMIPWRAVLARDGSATV